jgi:hypothetical protein
LIHSCGSRGSSCCAATVSTTHRLNYQPTSNDVSSSSKAWSPDRESRMVAGNRPRGRRIVVERRGEGEEEARRGDGGHQEYTPEAPEGVRSAERQRRRRWRRWGCGGVPTADESPLVLYSILSEAFFNAIRKNCQGSFAVVR